MYFLHFGLTIRGLTLKLLRPVYYRILCNLKNVDQCQVFSAIRLLFLCKSFQFNLILKEHNSDFTLTADNEYPFFLHPDDSASVHAYYNSIKFQWPFCNRKKKRIQTYP